MLIAGLSRSSTGEAALDSLQWKEAAIAISDVRIMLSVFVGRSVVFPPPNAVLLLYHCHRTCH